MIPDIIDVDVSLCDEPEIIIETSFCDEPDIIIDASFPEEPEINLYAADNTPLIRINPYTRDWEVSYDSGFTWKSLGVNAGEGGGGGGEPAGSPTTRIGEITLLASAWEGNEDPYSQVVRLPYVTPTTKIDLQPSVEQLAIFHDKDLAFVTENDNGIVTVYAIGDRPTNDYTMQVSMKEVIV